jgi:phospholipid/cholesterol/gamma-HCH transport system substrate-binding protein
MTRELKVGLFVIFGLALGMVAVFLIGDTRQLWSPKREYRTTFQDVAGLKPGAPVRMGGLDIGSVTTVGYGGDLGDRRISVKLSINESEAKRIRSDSTAHVVNKGLLGDKMIEVTTGSPNSQALDSKAPIPSDEPADVFSEARKVAEITEQTIEQLQPLAHALGDPGLANDIKGTAAGTHALLDAIVRGDGPIHRLFFDKREADRIDELLTRANETTERLDGVLAEVQDLTDHIQKGPGIAHALIYDGDMSKDAAGAVLELHNDLRAIREGNGIAHAVIYGDNSSQHVMANLNAMSDDLRVIVGDMRQGKGTLGALLVDPTVYEDIKSLVGNVERNEVLRALVRYSIKANESAKSP